MRVSGGSSSAQLFFITSTDARWDEAKVVYFQVIGDEEFHTYFLNMSIKSTWKGQITGLRLDPTEKITDIIEVDYIRVESP